MKSCNIRATCTKHLEKAIGPIPVTKWLKIGISALSAGLLCFGLINMAHADQVIMKNGDRRQGTIVSMCSGELRLKPIRGVEVTVIWEEVATLSTDKPVRAYLKSGEILIGKIRSGENNALTLEPGDGNLPVALHMSQIKMLQQPVEPMGWDLDVNLSGKISSETGKPAMKCDMISDLTISNLSDLIKFYGEFHREWAGEKLIKDNATGSGSYDLFLDKRWFLFGDATAKTDKLEGLDLRGHVAAGPGCQIWKSGERNLSVKVGPAYECEKYVSSMKFLDNGKERDSLALYCAPGFDMWFFRRSFQFFHNDNIVYDFQNNENWTLRTHTGIRVPILSDLVGSFQFGYEYDSHLPEGKIYENRSWKFGLAYSF